MLKRYSSILFLFTAGAILLGHGIIPHHHHHDKNSHEETHHHDLAHHHDHESGIDGLHNIFSNIIHPEEGFTFLINLGFSSFFSSQVIAFTVLPLPDFAFNTIDLPPLFDRPPSDHPNSYSFFYSCTFGLRAPPAL